MAGSDEPGDVRVELEGAEAKGLAGRLGGRAVRNYYSEHPWIGVVVALLSSSSIIIGYAAQGILGLLAGAVITVFIALLPPARIKHRDESEW